MSALDVLFVHNNFPAQFRNLAATFASLPGCRVAAIGAGSASAMAGVDLRRYGFSGRELSNVHPFARRFEIESRRAEQVMYSANAMKYDGFTPQLIYVHPGWGEALPLRVLFPDATLCCYSEFYYAPSGTDVGFDREFPPFGIDGETRIVLRNAATLLALTDADFAVAPTEWQRSVFPREFRDKIHVVHDGLDCDRLMLRAPARAREIAGIPIPDDAEIVTFVARNLEPYRGFHVFMRALPRLLAKRPRARVFLVGGDKVGYGAGPPRHASWRQALLEELDGRLDLGRVHFTGSLPYESYLALLVRSDAHCYLTYPFVLSWSMLEAMALGCLVVGSDTGPVTEVITHGENGLLVPFFDTDAIADTIADALAHPRRMRRLREAARHTARSRYDFARVSLPRHVDLLHQVGCSQRLVELLAGVQPADI
ncbi:glycosyltransferase [Rhabdaerophilum calidifontis]|uniref:glycosyltransferase n=1 Tax=Rhabdaerophilum calidifontis TaxID=2604328 RepID=UPI001239288B|nr:glycosyltransferase [Rhabdaerophilum calidifontis]